MPVCLVVQTACPVGSLLSFALQSMCASVNASYRDKLRLAAVIPTGLPPLQSRPGRQSFNSTLFDGDADKDSELGLGSPFDSNGEATPLLRH